MTKGPTLKPNFVPVFKKEVKTIPELLQEVVDDMCEHYCRYPKEWDAEAEGYELEDSDICLNCPLNRLV